MPKTSKTPNDCRVPRPPNRWILFLKANRKLVMVPDIPGETPKEHLGRISQAVSELYKKLSREDLSHWDVVAKEEKENHALRNPNYRYEPRRSNKNSEQAGLDVTKNRPGKRRGRKRQASPVPLGSGNHSDVTISPLALDGASTFLPFTQLHNSPDHCVRETFYEGLAGRTSHFVRKSQCIYPFPSVPQSFSGPHKQPLHAVRLSWQEYTGTLCTPSDVLSTLAPGFVPNPFTDHEFSNWFQPPTPQQDRMADELQHIQPVPGRDVEEVNVVNSVEPVGPQNQYCAEQYAITNVNQTWARAFQHNWTGESVGNYNDSC